MGIQREKGRQRQRQRERETKTETWIKTETKKETETERLRKREEGTEGNDEGYVQRWYVDSKKCRDSVWEMQG